MRKILLGFFLFHILICVAQKPAIEINSFYQWPIGLHPCLSKDGKFMSYFIYNEPTGGRSIAITSANKKWKKKIENGKSIEFTKDNKHVIYVDDRDRLYVQTLNSDSFNLIADSIGKYKYYSNGKEEFIIYLQNNHSKTLTTKKLYTDEKQVYSSVIDFFLNDQTNALVYKKNEGDQESIVWLNINTHKQINIFSSVETENFVFDNAGKQLAFLARTNSRQGKKIYLYKEGTARAIECKNYSPGHHLEVTSIKSFNRDDTGIFLYLEKADSTTAKKERVQVDIWSYNDSILLSKQKANLNPNSFYYSPKIYASILNLSSNKIIQLENEAEKIIFPDCSADNDENLILEKETGDYDEWFWNPISRISIYIISSKTGSRKLIRENVKESPKRLHQMSPNGKYLLFFDSKDQNYFSYEIATDSLRNITKTVNTKWTIYDQDDKPISQYWPYQTAQWHQNSVFLYDQNDIWQVYLDGHIPPINITGYYGKKNDIVFKILPNSETWLPNKIFLSSFNRQTKENGFYTQRIDRREEPNLLSKGNYIAYIPDHDPSLPGLAPLKAQSSNCYLIEKQSATTSPNYFITTDFIKFTQISEIEPEKNYNWLTADLISWSDANGKTLQGLLYKPENFDTSKKYPIILDYYERRSDELNLYHKPEATGNRINIPYFVSNGYLVFVPDIHYTLGNIGTDALNSITSAVTFLSQYSFVDRKKIGLQGHSFGGYQTNFVITQTSMFAAACSASGFCDLISFYGSAQRHSYPIYWSEMDQGRMGTTPWDHHSAYISNSPIYFVDKVQTPLLMMNNKNDNSVPFSQGIEFFTSLRRLGKKVWMLQYNNGGHSLSGEDAEDFHVKMVQFFNYYLKDGPRPIWMKPDTILH